MAAFVRTASTNLTRQSARGPLVYVEPGGDLQATVLAQHFGRGQGEGLVDALLARDSLLHLDERHTVVDEQYASVFYVERYRAASSPSFAVFDPGGAPLAVYVSEETLLVRDGTGAPVATVRDGDDLLAVVETGGGLIAQCWRSPLYLQWLVDDQWSLTVLEEPKVLDRRALVALPLVCRLLWSHGVPRDRTDAEMSR
jgi:hypothetical protein